MSLKGKKIIVDAGHGGAYDGAHAIRIDGTIRKEKDIALKVAKKVQTKLAAEGAYVYMTRTTDVDFGGATQNDDINKRVAYINKMNASHALISIHLQPDTVTSRTGAFYYSTHVASKAFAETMAKALDTSARVGDFAILRDTTVADQKSLLEIDGIGNGELDYDGTLNVLTTKIVNGLRNHFK